MGLADQKAQAQRWGLTRGHLYHLKREKEKSQQGWGSHWSCSQDRPLLRPSPWLAFGGKSSSQLLIRAWGDELAVTRVKVCVTSVICGESPGVWAMEVSQVALPVSTTDPQSKTVKPKLHGAVPTGTLPMYCSENLESSTSLKHH